MVNGPPTNIMYMKMESKQVEQAEQAVPSKANSAEHLDARAMQTSGTVIVGKRQRPFGKFV